MSALFVKQLMPSNRIDGRTLIYNGNNKIGRAENSGMICNPEGWRKGVGGNIECSASKLAAAFKFVSLRTDLNPSLSLLHPVLPQNTPESPNRMSCIAQSSSVLHTAIHPRFIPSHSTFPAPSFVTSYPPPLPHCYRSFT